MTSVSLGGSSCVLLDPPLQDLKVSLPEATPKESSHWKRRQISRPAGPNVPHQCSVMARVGFKSDKIPKEIAEASDNQSGGKLLRN